MSSFLLLALIAFFQSHQLDAQVVFARQKGSIVQSGNDTVASYERLHVTYFDSRRVAKCNSPGSGESGFDQIDSLLGKTADSLFRITAEEAFSGKTSKYLELIPAIPPVRFLNWKAYRVSSRFGWRQHPIEGDIRLHNGIDLPQPAGTPVFATADGIVKWISWQPDGLGLAVCLEHPTGYQSIYGHLSGRVVREGDKVRRGLLIGRVGSTGLSTGPHLHYTILYQGNPVDPAQYCFLWMKLTRTGRVSKYAKVLPAPDSAQIKNRLRNR